MITVLCFGNEWHGDDGFGMEIYKKLKTTPLPDYVNVIFSGTNSLLAWKEVINSSYVILVDACQREETDDLPGSLHWSNPEMFSKTQQRNLHDGGLEELIRHREILSQGQKLPTLEILFVYIDSITAFHKGLSNSVKASIPLAVDMIIKQIQAKESML
ncbi:MULTISPECIES: hydrogenase maturation protease [unclassified Neptuniibacter]|uniref:hydrogenase maturation protease n=1 Tax=unclassified Neptuniibacter TaxID=2630693 RepID=UPI000C676CE9|nr:MULTISPECIES: hydrogenase maturation protease [unclassified Neptuniibacter]MAY40849.1 hypothetical protein [Oceanospirillaceae bacterium]|tara:strand:- start:13250 stop:13723 length:474 start_codon:yes stop_codon:yes gene_type:complete